MIRACLVAAMLTASAAAGPGAYAQSDQDAALRAMQSGEIRPYAEIRKITEAALDGTVIGQDPPRRAGKRWVYSLRVLQRSGRVLNVQVDAKSGKILKKKGDQ